MKNNKGLKLAKDYVAFDSSHIPIWHPSHSEKDDDSVKNKKVNKNKMLPRKNKTPNLTKDFLKKAALKMKKSEIYLYLLQANSPVKFRFMAFYGRGDFDYGYRCWVAYEKKALREKNIYYDYVIKNNLLGEFNAHSAKISQKKMRFTAISSFRKFKRRVDRYLLNNRLPSLV